MIVSHKPIESITQYLRGLVASPTKPKHPESSRNNKLSASLDSWNKKVSKYLTTTNSFKNQCMNNST